MEGARLKERSICCLRAMYEDQTMKKLTTRQHEVLALVAHGKRNQHIARVLCITEHTVEAHLRSIYQKLAVRTRTAASKQYWRWCLGQRTQS